MADSRRFVRFRHEGRWRYGLSTAKGVVPLKGSIFGRWERAGRPIAPGSVKIGPPCRPSKIIAVGINYRAHAEEMGHQLPESPKLFLKPPSALVGPGDPIRFPSMAAQVDYEAELAVVIARKTADVPLEKALSHVFGYTCLNDVTARDLQRRDGQWTRAKSFDTFAPLGPAIATGLDPAALVVEAYLNGVRRQSSSTADLLFTVPELVRFVSRVMTLLPGDVIATGTPAGVGPMEPGDSVEIRIEGIGSLHNPVVR
jgi:2-keto-4-pentenoate hydratase/2-oxohepta-3-ene-1,7-dioic acid hydratase in catechol pathway